MHRLPGKAGAGIARGSAALGKSLLQRKMPPRKSAAFLLSNEPEYVGAAALGSPPGAAWLLKWSLTETAAFAAGAPKPPKLHLPPPARVADMPAPPFRPDLPGC